MVLHLYMCLCINDIYVFFSNAALSRCCVRFFFFFQAEDGIRDLVRSRGLGDVYKRQSLCLLMAEKLLTGRMMGRNTDLSYAMARWDSGKCLSLIHI